MPEFPRYESKGQLTTQQPSFLAAKDTSGEVLDQVAKVGGELQDMTLKWAQAEDVIKSSGAKAKRKTDLLNVTNAAQNDTSSDITTLQKNHKTRVQDLEKTYKEDITYNFKANQFQDKADADYDLAAGKIQLENLYKKQSMDIYASDIEVSIQAEISNPTDQSLSVIQAKLNQGVGSLLLSREAATKRLHKANEDLGFNRVSKDLYEAETTEDAKAIKANIKNGLYEAGGVTISASEKSKLMTKAEVKERRIATNENFAERIRRSNTTHELIQMANNDVLDPGELEEKFINKEISNSTYLALQQHTTSPVGPSAQTEPQTYHALITSLLKMSENPSDKNVEEARNMVLNANSDGKLSREDASKIYQMHFGQSKSLQESLGEEAGGDFNEMKARQDAIDADLKDKTNYLKTAYNMIKPYFYGVQSDESITNALKNIYTNVLSGGGENKEIITEADKEIARELLKQHPEWGKLPESGRSGVDRYGNKVVVYPDGRVVMAT